MAKMIGFLSTGADLDTYLYVETDSGESFALGSDVGTGTFNLNTLSVAGAIPDESTSNIAIDPGVNGDLVLQPNGTGLTYINSTLNMPSGDFQLVNGLITLGGVDGTDGQLIIAATAGNPAWANLTSTGGSITITNGANTINLEAGGGMLSQVDTDSGSATPLAGVLNVLGSHGLNTTGSGNTVTVLIDNAITLGDLSTIAAGSDALTITSGDITLSGTGATGANINIPSTSSNLAKGVIEQNGTRVFHTYSAGAENVFIGSGAGNGTLTGVANYIVSNNGGLNLTTGGNNTGMGQYVFEDLVSGGGNCAFGTGALRNVLGSQNVGVGNSAGSTLTTGSYNTFLGYVAGSSVGAASASNIYLGNAGASESNTIRIGTQGTGNAQQNRAFMAGITSQTITGLTSKPVVVETTGQLGVAGNLNLPSTTAALTSGVITINGERVLHTYGSTRNTFVGRLAGNGTLTGVGNTALGNTNLSAVTTGVVNTGVGDAALAAVTTGSYNNMMGGSAGTSITQGSNNVGMGHQLGINLTTGSNNILLGGYAGKGLSTGTESSNILIQTDPTGGSASGTAGDANTIRIGINGSGAGQQNKAFIAGIYNITPAGGTTEYVIIDSNGQLGSTSSGGSFADSFPTDSGTATPSSGALNILGGSNINTSGASNNVTVNLDNTVSISGSMTCGTSSGDLTCDQGNINLSSTNAGGTVGVIEQNSRRLIHTQSLNAGAPNQNLFFGENAGNFGLGAGSSGNHAFGYLALGSIATGATSNLAIGQGSLGALTTGDQNTMVGTAGQTMTTASNNTGVGHGVLRLATLSENTAVGSLSLFDATTAEHNTTLGYATLTDLTTGDDNIAIGHNAGTAYTSSESDNILIGNTGTITDGNTIRIGTQGTGAGQQDTTFIAGIYNVTPSGGNDGIVIIDSNGQLGSSPAPTPRSAFWAQNNTTRSNVTGDGTWYTIPFEVESFDLGSDYNTTTGVFTAPYTGYYRFSARAIIDFDGADVPAAIRLVSTGITVYGQSTQTLAVLGGNDPAVDTLYGWVHIDTTISMTASDTAYIQIVTGTSGGSATSDVPSIAGHTYFCGELLN